MKIIHKLRLLFIDFEHKNVIDKLAQFVARNGADFENMTKMKQKDNPNFGFLFGGPHYNYYQYRVTSEQAVLRQRGQQMQQQQPLTPNSMLGQSPFLSQEKMYSPPVSMTGSSIHQAFQRQIDEAQEKIRESHKNLSAQHEVLTKQQLTEASLARYRQLEIQHNDFVAHQTQQINQWKVYPLNIRDHFTHQYFSNKLLVWLYRLHRLHKDNSPLLMVSLTFAN